jgi:hypothetical protein
MSVTFGREAPVEDVGLHADRRLYVTRGDDRVPDAAADARADQRVVEEGDPDAAFLLVAEGSVIPLDVAAKYGLSVVDGKIVLPSAAVPDPAPAGDVAPPDASGGGGE